MLYPLTTNLKKPEFPFMKSDTHKILRISASIVVIFLVILNLGLFTYFLCNYTFFDIEKSLTNYYSTLGFFSKSIVYMNLLGAFLSSYSLNTGYSLISNICIYFTLVINIFGLFSIRHLARTSFLSVEIYLNHLSPDDGDKKLLADIMIFTGMKNVDLAKSEFLKVFSEMYKAYFIVELVSMIGFVIIATEIIIIKYTKSETPRHSRPVTRRTASLGTGMPTMGNRRVLIACK